MLICVRATSFFPIVNVYEYGVAFVHGKIKKTVLLCRPAPTRGEPCRSLVPGYVLLYIFIQKTINILKRIFRSGKPQGVGILGGGGQKGY